MNFGHGEREERNLPLVRPTLAHQPNTSRDDTSLTTRSEGAGPRTEAAGSIRSHVHMPGCDSLQIFRASQSPAQARPPRASGPSLPSGYRQAIARGPPCGSRGAGGLAEHSEPHRLLGRSEHRSGKSCSRSIPVRRTSINPASQPQASQGKDLQTGTPPPGAGVFLLSGEAKQVMLLRSCGPGEQQARNSVFHNGNLRTSHLDIVTNV